MFLEINFHRYINIMEEVQFDFKIYYHQEYPHWQYLYCKPEDFFSLSGEQKKPFMKYGAGCLTYTYKDKYLHISLCDLLDALQSFGNIIAWINNVTSCHFALINQPNEIYGCRSNKETVTLFRHYNDTINYNSDEHREAFNKRDYCNMYPISKKVCEVTFPKKSLIKAAYYCIVKLKRFEEFVGRRFMNELNTSNLNEMYIEANKYGVKVPHFSKIDFEFS